MLRPFIHASMNSTVRCKITSRECTAPPRGDQLQDAETLATIAAKAFAALRDTRQIALFSSRPGGLTIDNAYRATPLVRQMYEAHGSKVLGRKIGFTNRTIWTQYGVSAPVWGYIFNNAAYDLAAVETLSLEPFSEPRIEPEILGTVPSVQMNDTSLSSCID